MITAYVPASLFHLQRATRLAERIGEGKDRRHAVVWNDLLGIRAAAVLDVLVDTHGRTTHGNDAAAYCDWNCPSRRGAYAHKC